MRVVLEDGTGVRIFERGPRRSAEATPILLLHGFTGSVDAWGEDLLARLAKTRRVLAVDLPGHGESDLPACPGSLDLGSVVTRLTGVLDRRGVERPVWAGYSMGGRVALGAAAIRPERVAALVLESASPGLESEDARARRRALDESRAAALESKGIEAWVEEWMDLPLFATQRALPPSVLAQERRRRLGNSVEALARTLRELGTGSQPSFWDDLAGIDVPVLLLTGERDTRFCSIADRVVRRVPAGCRATVPGAGHAVHLEAPDAWLEAVEGFLNGLFDAP